ncbi:MAG TPA: ISL3 family transposase [Steroidobacteraceae bacterium]
MRDTLFRAMWPAGLIVETVATEENRITINAHPAARDAACPDCAVTSSHVHSRYERRLLDLPSHGRSVQLLVRVRRFRCGNRSCQRRIFGEPLPDSTARRTARRTSRLEAIVHHLGVALGGRPAASLARRLMLPVSKDTLLRVVRRRALPFGADTVRVLGIDDFAWKRGQRYGTLLCDLEQRRIIDLLPDREAGTVEAWLADHPEIIKISRDRGGGYGQAATKAAPQAVQIADRWHLMENASAAFLDAVRRSMRPIRQVLGSTVIDPALLTCAERIQYDGYLRRQESHQTIKRLADTGTPIKEITRRTGRSRKLVRSVLRGEDGDVFRCRESMLRPFLGKLGAEWEAGCRNGAELWRRLRATGFKGGLRVVTEWATKRRRSERSGRAASRTVPPARLLSRLMTLRRDHLSKADAITVAAIETGVPMLATARDLLERFHGIIRARDTDAFAPWLTDTEGSLIASFGKGINGDLAAVRAALTEPWSNGQTEGQITKLKLVKRQMYGRAKLDLLRARLIVPA